MSSHENGVGGCMGEPAEQVHCSEEASCKTDSLFREADKMRSTIISKGFAQCQERMELHKGQTSADIKAEYESEGDPVTRSTVMSYSSGHPLFTVRSANTRAQTVGTKSTQKHLSSLLNFYEGGIASEVPENNTKHSSRGMGMETSQAPKDVSKDVSNRQTKADHLSDHLKTQNHEKVAEDQTQVGLIATVGRLYGSNGSKSVEWRGDLNGDESKASAQSLWKYNQGRRAESLETALGKGPDKSDPVSNGVQSRINVYTISEKIENKKHMGWSTDNSCAAPHLKKSSYQSLPTRIKSYPSGVGEGGSLGARNENNSLTSSDFGPGNTELEISNCRPTRLPGHLSILDRIEKLYGSHNLAIDMNHDKSSHSSEPAENCSLYTTPRIESHRRSANNTEWINVPYKCEKGGSFPKRHSGGKTCSDSLKPHRNKSGKNGNDALILDQDMTSVVVCSKVSSCITVKPRTPGPKAGNVLPCLKGAPLQNRVKFVKEVVEKAVEEQGNEMGEQEDKKSGLMQSKVQNVDQEKVGEKWPGGRVKEDDEDGNIQTKMLRCEVIQKSPTLRSCTTLGWPPEERRLTSEEANLTDGQATKEAKEPTTDHVCSKVDRTHKTLVQPSASEESGEEDVFKVKSLPKTEEKSPDPAKPMNDLSFNNVRSKIHKFESLAQSSLISTFPRRAFSVPEQPKDVGGWTNMSSSNKVISQRKGKVSAGPEGIRQQCFYKEGRETQAKEDGWITRSFSVVEVGESRCDGANKSSNLNQNLEISHSSGAAIQTRGTLLSNSGEQNYSKDICKDLKNAERCEEGFKDFNSKQPISLPETKKTNNDSGDLNKKRYCMKKHNIHNPVDVTLCTENNLSSSLESPTDDISHSKSNATKRDCGSEKEAQVSKNLPNISVGPLLPPFSNLLQSYGISSIPNTCAFMSDPGHLLPQPSSSLLQQATQPTISAKDGSTCSFSVCMPRWSSDEEQSEEDDDDSTQKNEDSNYDSDSAESSVTITSNMSQLDRRSFSVTLSDLCHFGGVDYTYHDNLLDAHSEDSMSLRTASLSSDVSALSCVSILSSDELERLLTDVKSLGDETLQNYEEVQVVLLHKEVGSGLGFTVAGGTDQNKPITIHKVFPGGLAAQEGSIQEGDQVLSINGSALQNSTHWEALRTLRRARSRGMAVIVLQKVGIAKPKKVQPKQTQEELDKEMGNFGNRKLNIVLNKYSSDLGFSLEGGLDSSQGNRPIIVKKVFHGGPVDEVLPGDELLEIQGHSLQGLHRLEAWNLIKKLPPGPVEVVLNRTV